MKSDASVDFLRDIPAFESLAADWAGLPQPAQEFPVSLDWIATAAATLYEPGKLRFVRLQRNDELIALAPLAVARTGDVERWEIAGATTLFEPCGCGYRDDESLAALCAAVINGGRPVVLQRIPSDDPLLEAFKKTARGRGQLLQFNASGAPFIAITTGWEEYFQTLSSRRRQDYRRARRGLEKQGQVAVEILSPTADTVDACISEAMQVEAASWKGRNGSAMQMQPRLSGFFRQLAQRLARQGRLRVCFLRLNGAAVAMQIAAIHAQRWWVLKIGYDERWSEHSPGIQLMWEALREAFERGLKSFEMLGSAEPWLTIWTREQRTYRTLAFYPYNVRGMVALGADIMRAFGRRLRSRGAVARVDK